MDVECAREELIALLVKQRVFALPLADAARFPPLLRALDAAGNGVPVVAVARRDEARPGGAVERALAVDASLSEPEHLLDGGLERVAVGEEAAVGGGGAWGRGGRQSW